jgi:uncharacterized lipoprotein
MKKKHSNTQLPLDLSSTKTSSENEEKVLRPSAPQLTIVKNSELKNFSNEESQIRNRNLQRIVDYSNSLSW